MRPRLSDVFLRTQTDERLAALAEHGHERAFGVLVERYRPRLIRAAGRLVGADRAEDVAQQALLRAWSAVQAGTTVNHVSGWLHQILRNTAYTEHARSRRDGPLTDDLADLHSSAEDVESRLVLGALLDEMAKMPDNQRAALIQTEFDGRSRREVAAGLGVSEGAVRQLVYRARSTLRATVTAVTPFPLAAWAARPRAGSVLAHRVAELGGQSTVASSSPAVTGGALFGGGALIKGGATVLAAGVLGGGVVIGGLVTASPHRVPGVLPIHHARAVADLARDFTLRRAPAKHAKRTSHTPVRHRGGATTGATTISRPSVSPGSNRGGGSATSHEGVHPPLGTSRSARSPSEGDHGSTSSSDAGLASSDPTNGQSATSSPDKSTSAPDTEQPSTTPGTPPATDQSTGEPEPEPEQGN